MGDSLDDMIWLRKQRQEEARTRKQTNMAASDLTGWMRLSEHHFRRMLSGQGFVDWWPTTRKFIILGKGANQFRGKYRTGDPNDFIAKHSTLSFVKEPV